MKKRKIGLVFLSALFGIAVIIIMFSTIKGVYPLSWGMHEPIRSTEKGAVSGYDAVAYHHGKAIAGKGSYQWQWKGVNWYFSSEENLQTFQSDPKKYAPAYGGYCAFAVSKGFTAAADPEVWHVEEGMLYLFDSESVKEDWLTGLPNGIISKCRDNWSQ